MTCLHALWGVVHDKRLMWACIHFLAGGHRPKVDPVEPALTAAEFWLGPAHLLLVLVQLSSRQLAAASGLAVYRNTALQLKSSLG